MLTFRDVDEAWEMGSAFINRCVVDDRTDYHSHNFVEIAYVAGGSGTHIIKGKPFEVQKGNITLINFDVPHQFVAGNSELLIYNCVFTPDYLGAMFAESRNFFDAKDHFLLGNFLDQGFESYINVIAGSGENAHVLNIFERMLKEYESKQIGYKEIMRGYLIELLVLIFRLQIRTGTGSSQKLLESLDYINNHFTEEIKLEVLADMSNISVSHFCRLFKSLTGVTVTGYVQSLRMDEACRLLGATDKNVVEIASDVGYSDMKHFYSVFKKVTGKLPKEFR